eukprot:CAMPEP_0197887172 /NCGR_PEP_ID=MMETSP1439-20131203/19281_1 /TAXON_ID=66791 /ORGANISM="Gonyaulax spinifera, Strain CCMP409" /LENGTH=440 /DNA_ID=CAMNT_0043506999 /DNA_START=92 /DNA_END=1414 /DNA_ORIENTATION=+
MLNRTPVREEYAEFHERTSFYGIWILVILVGVHTLGAMRPILEPLLWAFFFMMGLLPLTDNIEWLILRLCSALPPCRSRRPPQSARKDAEASEHYSGVPRQAPAPAADVDSASSETETESNSEEIEACCNRGCGMARMTAVILVIGVFLGTFIGFFMIIYQSALHMRRDFHHYTEGAQRISEWTNHLKDRVPDAVLQQATTKALNAMEGIVNFLLQTMMEKATGLLVEVLMMLLYMAFWLCEPVHVGEAIPALFKQYIVLKSIASGTYAFCIWALLHSLRVDLSAVFGLITFFFNFVPEVGPFLSIMLPIPVILFDGRLKQPLMKVFIALLGQLCLKFVFGNIIEVKLVERQDDMKMHPVMILFSVAFFGYVWGATGMLLSVPIMATFKAMVHVMPPSYRNGVLILLEGDKEAPSRYLKRRLSSGQKVKSRRSSAVQHNE